MKVKVDWDLCESNAMCVRAAPELFKVDDQDVLHVLVEGDLSEDLQHKLKRAVRAYLAPMLPDAELDALLAEGVQVKAYGGGEALFTEGDAPDGLYLIRRGSVTISLPKPRRSG